MKKRLVICCDGTWNTRDQSSPTNVAKIAQAILPSAPDGVHQVVYYDAGVGTDWGRIARFTGGAFGRGLSENIAEAYRFIADNYEAGDELFFFGFSRGAFTVRSTVGLMRNCWVLQKHWSDLYPQAFALYRANLGPDAPEAVRFRETYAHDVDIAFVGVWDTVGALGTPGRAARRRHGFHDVRLSRKVRAAYQALAIDEQRKAFRPAVWEATPMTDAEVRERGYRQRVEQAWFPGVHSDVGGGYADSGLSDIAFTWMADRAREHGLALDEVYMRQMVRPDPLAPIHDSMSGPFRFLGRMARPIGALAVSVGHESLHPAARTRWEAESTRYDPANLADFMEGRTATHRLWRRRPAPKGLARVPAEGVRPHGP